EVENLQISESRISDVNIALEMVNFTKNQILTQSALAILTQANSISQLALKLIS
ncbi:MAG: flagellin, partial [Desulfovibrionaceae bacterium]|nr:flagellin [Desulfovibrionaceae bacterium]